LRLCTLDNAVYAWPKSNVFWIISSARDNVEPWLLWTVMALRSKQSGKNKDAK
jgi:hypothetical protein